MALLVAITVASAASGPVDVESEVGWSPVHDALETGPLTESGLSEPWTSKAPSDTNGGEDHWSFPWDPEKDTPQESTDLVFPVAGEHTLTESFGDPRGGGTRSHQGIDILASKGTPVVAVADGVVRWVQDEPGGRCCAVSLLHDDFRTRYIHLDNDTPGTDDGRRVGIAEGIEPGAQVRQGQLLGWVGDSGNAEATVPHLHFELRLADGTPLDPLSRLRTASDVEPPNETVARR